MNPVRLGIILVTVGAILIVATIGAFGFFFYTQDVSSNVNDWGAFGSYLGGVLGASISTLALIGAVIAIYQQHQTDQRVNNHTIASDLMRSIERLEDSIDGSLRKITIRLNYPAYKMHRETDALRILTEIYSPDVIAGVIQKYSDDGAAVVNSIMDEKLSEQERLEKVTLYEVFSNTSGKLRFMRELLVKHKVLADHNVAAIYYKRKYKVAVKRLREAGYPVETWDDISEM